MVPCPWARDAAAMYRGEDVGVHLTLNSEWETYRWGPITHSPSLLDGDGGFPRTIEDVWDHADLDEVRKECRAQSSGPSTGASTCRTSTRTWGRCSSAPSSSTSTSSWRSTSGSRCAWPARARNASSASRTGGSLPEERVVFPDHFVYTSVGSRRAIEKALFELAPGVTEVYLHPGIDTDELRVAPPTGRTGSRTTRTSRATRRFATSSTAPA